MAQDKDQKTLNVPPLRFPSFTDEWKRSTLKDYLIENKERNSRGEFSKDEVLSVSGDKGIVNQIQLLGRSYAGQSVMPYHIVRRNNIVYTKSPLSEFPYGIVKMNRGKDGIVSTLYAVYSVLDSADSSFIEYYFASKDRTNRYFKPIVRIGAKHDMKIGNTEVLENQVNFPDKTEQCRISEFLELIDERIDTQNKIIEDLKKLKSALIDSLLGRVQTDESDRMVKLGEIGKFTRGLTYSAEDIVEDGGIVVARANNLSNGEAVNLYNEIVRVDKPISDSQLLKYGDMVICMANGSSALVGKASYYNETTDSIATIGAFCGIYRSDRKIVRWLLQTNKYKRAIHKSLQGGNGAIANLTPNDILGLSFIIPKQEPSIVVLLQGFDEKLDIEISLLHSLQKEKQYLLSQMFI